MGNVGAYLLQFGGLYSRPWPAGGMLCGAYRFQAAYVDVKVEFLHQHHAGARRLS